MKAKFVFIPLALCVWFAAMLHSAEHELPMFGKLPNPGKNWSQKDDGGTIDTRFSWIHFDNIQSGDVLGFVAWRSPGIKVTHDPVRQASIEQFTGDGYSRFSESQPKRLISDVIRHRVVSLNVQNHGANLNFSEQAIEYSYVYEGRLDAPSSLAHGYVVVLEDTVLFVQHTSTNVITSELAQDMVLGLLFRHFKSITGNEIGWSGSIDQSPGDE